MIRPSLPAYLIGMVLVFSSLLVAQPPETPPPQRPHTQEPNNPEEEEQPPEEDTSRITDLPLLEEMAIPSAKELLTGQKVTWIILVNTRVVLSRSITPRPDTLDKLATELTKLRQQGRPSDLQKREIFEQQVHKLRRVQGGFLEESEFPEFAIEVKNIDRIWHHEDLLLKRVDLLLNEKQFQLAYELLFTLQHSKPDWPGLTERYHRMIFLTAKKSLVEDQTELALSQLDQLFKLEPRYPQLTEQLSSVTKLLIDQSLQTSDYRQARHFLHRLEAKAISPALVDQQRQRLVKLMQTRLEAAKDALETDDRANAVRLVTEAARIWPNSTELRDTHRELSRQYQILQVGVLSAAGTDHNYPFPSESDQRWEYLQHRRLFEIQDFDDSPHYRTTLIEQWEPTELGRHLDLRLKTEFDYWSSQRPVTAVELANSLRRAVDPHHPEYDEQLSGFLHTIHVRDPYRLELEFQRTPLRPEALLARRISASQTASSQDVLTWFEEFNRSSERCSFRRSIPEPANAPQLHVAEILEQAYPNEDEILRAMFRGEVDYIPNLPLEHVTSFEEQTSWVIRKFQLPLTHLLQFHPQSVLSSSSELRRALLYAIQRETLLHEEILKDAPEKFGRLTTSVFPTQSRASNPLVKDVQSDPYVALSLVLAAQKSLGGKVPVLRMVVPRDSHVRAVVTRMISNWERIGLKVQLVTEDDPAPEQWDLVYRTVTIAEPFTELWPLLTMQPTSRVADLQILPGWLRQELIQLDLTTNWDDARARLHLLHEALWQEVFYLPLWEVDRYSIARRHISGIPASPLTCYQKVNQWVVNPWFDQSRP